MRELEVLDEGHLKLSWEDRKEFIQEELIEQVRGEVKRLLEEASEAALRQAQGKLFAGMTAAWSARVSQMTPVPPSFLHVLFALTNVP